MQRALITRDFTVVYVAEHGSRRAPRRCTTSPRCGRRSRDRSCCGGWSSPATSSSWLASSVPASTTRWSAWALLTMFVVSAFFLVLMLGPGQPVRPPSTPPVGLRRARARTRCCRTTSWWPSTRPMLYLGYVGFTVPFAFAIAALVTGRLRRRLAGRDPALDAVRLGLPHRRHRARCVVGLRRARLGRLLGLGSRRERVAAAVAHRDRLPALGDGPGAPRHAAGLEPVAGVRHVRADDPRHLHHPFRCPRSRCTPSREGAVGPLLLAFFAVIVVVTVGSDRLAWRSAAGAGHDRLAAVARGLVPGQQPGVRRVRLRRACSARCSR